MTSKFIRKKIRSTKRWARKHRGAFTGVLFLFAGLLSYAIYIDSKQHSVNPTSYKQLLNLIAKAESSGNYNAYFGNANNSKTDFTAMSIAEIMQWQTDYVKKGSPSDAIGKYQIISPTLSSLVDELSIDLAQRFDEATQDRMAIALIERRGAISYVNQEITNEEFAANLAKEWAALPRVTGDKPSDSYYAGDGLNKSLVGVEEILEAIEPVSAQARPSAE